MKNRLFLTIVIFCFLLFSCSENPPEGFDLPVMCNNKCEVASDMNEFNDAVTIAASGFSNCICLKSGEIKGDVLIGKQLNIIGKNDGTTHFSGVESGMLIVADDTTIKNINIVSGEHGITVSKAKNVTLESIEISGISTKTSVIRIESGSVLLKDLKIKNISAGSLYGGRGIVVTGSGSDIKIENSEIDNVDATGLIINGIHDVNISQSTFSNCGFAGIWVQNLNEDKDGGNLKIVDSDLENNVAVSIEVLGRSALDIERSTIKGVEKREISMEVVGDGIVMKSSNLSENTKILSVKDVQISGFERAAIILDGENGKELKAASISGLKILNESGIFGLVVQNAVETESLRTGILENPFTENDKNLEEPLYLIESIEMQ